MGAVIDQKAFDKHLALRRRGAPERARGRRAARRTASGATSSHPTLVETDDPGHRLLCEEIFGPVVTVHVYDDARWSETLRVVDQTSPYALTGAVFAQDRRAVREALLALRNAAGNFYVNDKPTGAVVGPAAVRRRARARAPTTRPARSSTWCAGSARARSRRPSRRRATTATRSWPRSSAAGGDLVVRPRSLAERSSPPLEVAPDRAIHELSRRLTLATLAIAAAVAVSQFLTLSLGAAGWAVQPNLRLHAAIGGALLVVSLLVAAVARGDRLPRKRLLNLGLAYEVLVALGISLQDNLDPIGVGRPLHDISWVAVLIVMFPLVVAASPARTLVASLLAASTWPLAVLIGTRLGNPVPSTAVFALNVAENYIAALLAMVPALILQDLAAEMRRARQMGSYRLVERLGQGGMGEVWRARHDMLARPAAIKLVRGRQVGLGSGPLDAEVLRRFEREAQATAALHSPHTVELYDFGVTADGTFYYVMEILDGLDLEQLVRRFGPVPPERAVHLLTQLCDSLADAHAVGLVHRDVKPSNVYTCRKGLRYDFVKLLDFGLVKPAWRDNVGDSSLTAEDAVPGTPAYLAPEVALGSLDVDGRADLYAAGCVAYWLLTGHRVFDGGNAVQMAVQHAQATPVPPSRRTDRPVPQALEALVLRCLEKDPARRPCNADELARELAACGLERGWSQDDARAWWRTHIAAS